MKTIETGLQVAAQALPPLVEREVRVASRRWTTYWTRVLVIVITGLPAIPYYTATRMGIAGNQGLPLLQMQAYVLFFWIVLSAVQMAADAVSSEKREGTLGLLFLTDLRSFDIVMGKLAACSLRAWHGLLAVVPVLGLPLLMGGVTFGDCLRLALLLANVLFVSLAVTLMISCLCRREYRAGSAASVVLAVLMGVIPIVRLWGFQHPILNAIDFANPYMPLHSFYEGVYLAAPKDFWIRIAAAHGLGWIAIGIASLVLPRVWQDRPVRRGGWRSVYEQWRLGSPDRRRQFRRETLDVSPMFWYASREQRTNWMPWVAIASIVVTMVCIHWLVYDGEPVRFAELIAVGWSVELIFKHWVAGDAGKIFARDRDTGALELVLSTGLANAEVAAGPLRALRRRFLGPAVAIVLIQILLLKPALAEFETSSRASTAAILLFVVHLLVFAMDMPAIAVMGLWKGVVSKNASQARASANWWVLLMPWVGTIGLTFLMAVGGGGSYEGIIVMFFLFGAVTCFASIQWAWNHLQENLRTVAFERFAGGEPWLAGWRQLGRGLAAMAPSNAGSADKP